MTTTTSRTITRRTRSWSSSITPTTTRTSTTTPRSATGTAAGVSRTRPKSTTPRRTCTITSLRAGTDIPADKGLLEQRLRQLPQLTNEVVAEHLQADVIGAVLPVRVGARLDRGRVAPRDDRVDERVAAFVREIRIAPSKPTKIVDIVLEPEI